MPYCVHNSVEICGRVYYWAPACVRECVEAPTGNWPCGRRPCPTIHLQGLHTPTARTIRPQQMPTTLSIPQVHILRQRTSSHIPRQQCKATEPLGLTRTDTMLLNSNRLRAQPNPQSHVLRLLQAFNQRSRLLARPQIRPPHLP